MSTLTLRLKAFAHLDFHVYFTVNFSIHAVDAIAAGTRGVLRGHHHGLSQASQL